MKVLLVKDKQTENTLYQAFQREGYDTDICDDRDALFAYLNSAEYDVIVSDIRYIYHAEMELIRRLRGSHVTIPVMLITSRSSVEEKVAWLDNGADDYIVRPFALSELFARMRALCRRPRELNDGVVRFGDVELNTQRREVYCTATDQMIQLGQKEAALLECMARHRTQVFTREYLTLKAWNYDSNAEYNNVEVYVSFTRKKLKEVGSRVRIKAVRGMGYKLETDAEL